MTRNHRGRFASTASPITAPLCFRRAKSARVAKGNRTRRVAAMRRCREAMERASDFPGLPAPSRRRFNLNCEG